MNLTFLGTGTSHGIPVIGCRCKVCLSSDVKDKRYRCSAWIQDEGKSFVIDTGPEFRLQALRAGICRLDAVFLTHSHADHLNGLDDLRVFSHTNAVDPSFSNKSSETKGSGLKIYADSTCIRDTKKRFDYIFTPVKEGGGKPKLNLIDVSSFDAQNPIKEGNLKIYPIPLLHGSLNDTGYLFVKEAGGIKKSIAYLTDCSKIPKASIELIKSCGGTLEHLVIDALRKEVHSTHFSFTQALDCAELLKANHTWFIHMTHNMSHTDLQNYIPTLLKDYPFLSQITKKGGSVLPAYDTLTISV